MVSPNICLYLIKKMRKVFVLVGHSNWGKSMTLRALTSGNRYITIKPIGGHHFFIRRMSNDDNAESLLDFTINKLGNKDYLIMTLCPTKLKKRFTLSILRNLRRSHNEIYFFVLKYKHNGLEQILDTEINMLSPFGTLEIYTTVAPAPTRAAAFRKFVEIHS
jgi:hypothetical protein